MSWLWLPLALAWTLALQYTLALLLAAFGCYLRDLQHLVPVAMTGLMFLSPVFYPIQSAPAPLAFILSINPLSAPIELFRLAWFGDAMDLEMALLQGLRVAGRAGAGPLGLRTVAAGFCGSGVTHGG